MAYIDGFVIGVPRKKMKSYEKTARARKKMWMKLKRDKTVVFSYILYMSARTAIASTPKSCR